VCGISEKGCSVGKFTKGPWKSTRVGSFSYEITTDHPFGHANYGIVVSEVRSEENARLIAAAPELAEALEALLDVVPFPTNGKDAEIYSRAKAALVKAVCR
jgi:hypothetical protein